MISQDRLEKASSNPLTDRLLSKIRKTETCWLWTGCKTKGGYGRITIGGGVVVASRAAYAVFIGEIPNGLFVCHRCDNPGCVNPEHLFVGTQSDNMKDSASKKRLASQNGRGSFGGQPLKNSRATHCPKGHPLTGDNLKIVDCPSKKQRRCRACYMELDRLYQRKKRAELRD